MLAGSGAHTRQAFCDGRGGGEETGWVEDRRSLEATSLHLSARRASLGCVVLVQVFRESSHRLSSNNGFSLCLLKRAPDEPRPTTSSDGSSVEASVEDLQRARRAEAVAEARLQALLERFDRDDEVHAASRGTRDASS